MRGTITKALILGCIALMAAIYPWVRAPESTPVTEALAAAGLGIGLIFAVAIVIHPPYAPYAASSLALCIGLAIGGTAASIEQSVGDLVGLSLLAGPVTMPIMAYLALRGVLPTGDRTRIVVNTLIMVLFVLLVGSVVLYPQGGAPLLIASPAGMLLSIAIGCGATLHAVRDAQALRTIVAMGQPRWMEWYGGVSFLVAMVWMYPETVRVLAGRYAEWRRGKREAEDGQP